MEKSSGNTKSLSDSILELTSSKNEGISSPEGLFGSADTNSASSLTESSNGFFGVSYMTWFIIIIILAFLGFNIFSYLSTGTQEVSNIFAPILKKLFGITLSTTTQTIDVAAEGGKAVVSGTASAANTGLSAVQNVTPMPKNVYSSVSSIPVDEEPNDKYKNNLNKTLNERNKGEMNDYVPHEASSSVHAKESGWCFIGSDNGTRTCSKVEVDDVCMSGDIFPSHEICVNPNLRE